MKPQRLFHAAHLTQITIQISTKTQSTSKEVPSGTYIIVERGNVVSSKTVVVIRTRIIRVVVVGALLKEFDSWLKSVS